MVGLCHVCGRPANLVCKLCGRIVCGKCLEPGGACAKCKTGPVLGAGG